MGKTPPDACTRNFLATMSTRPVNALNRSLLAPEIRKVGHELLDHQCWVFGRDVLNREDNLLIKHGFAQVRCPKGGLTQYELRHGLDEDSHVFLWGFGAFFGGEREGIFLTRSGFTPFRTQGRVELHDRDYHPFLEESSNIGLLLRAIEWFASYEDWIARNTSEHYRQETLDHFPRRTLQRGDLGLGWRALANRIAEDQISSG
jgi:hypothetical protein